MTAWPRAAGPRAARNYYYYETAGQVAATPHRDTYETSERKENLLALLRQEPLTKEV